VPVPSEFSFALSGQFSSAFASLPPSSDFGETSRHDKQRIRVNLVSIFGKLARLFFIRAEEKQGERASWL
jgi:hypothetical protein